MTSPSERADDAHRHADTELILERRALLDAPTPPTSAEVGARLAPGSEPPVPPAPGSGPLVPPVPPVAWGLALSGGGIRSATVSLGVLQAIAAAPSENPPARGETMPGAMFRGSLLSHFDYLSTVSGGGYAGAFLCSLFLPGRLRPLAEPPATAASMPEAEATARAADDAVRVLCDDPPGRRDGDGTYEPDSLHRAPLAWLRDNGRYLAPTGGGDLVYAGAVALRNWLAVHYVLGTVLLGMFSALAALVARVKWLRDLDSANLGDALAGTTWAEQIWWSPTLVLALLVVLLWVVPAGLAFWIPAPEGVAGRCRVFNRACFGFLLVIALFVLVTWLRLAPDDTRFDIWAGGCCALGIALVMFWGYRATTDDVDLLRVGLTRLLGRGLMLAAALLALALVDTAAHSIYLELVGDSAQPAHALAPASLVMAVVWAIQRIAKSADSFKPPEWLRRLPWTVIGGAAGLALLALLATAWGLAVVWVEWLGTVPSEAQVRGADHEGMLVWLTAAMLALAVLTGQFPSFINLSSLQSFYSARLTRAYLGASNGARFLRRADARKQSVAEPELQDGVAVADYLVTDPRPRLRTLAPLHLINVTMNNTVDPGEQLVQRDRKGEPLLVTPLGFTVSGRFHEFPKVQPRFEIQRTLTVGQWIGTSGAAFSTGIGRQTSLGLSLLLGAANVRLGTWWESGVGVSTKRSWPVRLLANGFRTHRYLGCEFLARFHGLRRRWQYLSDGGHFENTGLYELLRPSRGVEFIFACDNGADPGYEFGDLANLIRLVRIDLGLELEVDATVKDDPALRDWIGVPEDFRDAAAPRADAAQAHAAAGAREPVALLLHARPGGSERPSCWVLLLKPRVRADSPVDVVQYRAGHPSFPQEPTADQFFDEAQWEAYRKLGRDNAAALLSESVWGALHAHIAEATLPAAVEA